MITRWNPNHEIDGISIKRTHFNGKPTSDQDTLNVHRSPSTGRLVLHAEEKRLDDERTFPATVVFDAEDAIALAEWILANFKKGSK